MKPASRDFTAGWKQPDGNGEDGRAPIFADHLVRIATPLLKPVLFFLQKPVQLMHERCEARWVLLNGNLLA